MAKKFFIKERQNPQTGTYYSLQGQLTKKEAKKKEDTLYGFNIMHEYPSEVTYNEAIAKLKAIGSKIV